MESGFAPVGRVARTHGLNGEVSVIMTAGLPVESLVGLAVWFVPPPASVRGSRVRAVRPGPKGPLVSFEGVDDIDTASALRGTTVLVRATDLPEIEEEFDPVGLEVRDEERGVIGRITDVIVTGANDVWVVEGGPYGQVLVPDIEDVVLGLDEDDEDVVHVRLLPGLIEE